MDPFGAPMWQVMQIPPINAVPQAMPDVLKPQLDHEPRTSHSLNLEEFVEHWLNCPVCLDYAKDAVETKCCHTLLCQACKVECESCPICMKEEYQAKPAVFVRKMISAIPYTCSCGFKATRYDIDTHQAKCPGQSKQTSVDSRMKEAEAWPQLPKARPSLPKAYVHRSEAISRSVANFFEGWFGNSPDEMPSAALVQSQLSQTASQLASNQPKISQQYSPPRIPLSLSFNPLSNKQAENEESKKSESVKSQKVQPFPEFPSSFLRKSPNVCNICNEAKDTDMIYTEVACSDGCTVCVECLTVYGLTSRVCPRCFRPLTASEVEFITVLQASLDA
jgi:hypothetical protein